MPETSQPKKPVVVYVDDEPRNVSLVEVSLPTDRWSVHCFDSAVAALTQLKALDPAVIVTDQRMPQMTGLEFLEVCSQIAPDAVRIVVTGQTREETIVELVQRARIFDYITKPWQTNDLILRIQKALDFHEAIAQRRHAFAELQRKNLELERKTVELLTSAAEIKEQERREAGLRQEMEGWVPWPISRALKDGALKFPFRQDIVCLVFDIIASSALANVLIGGRAARTRIMRMFRELVISNGGMTESQGGDACYSHFGAFGHHPNPAQAALNTAREFRVKLRSFGKTNSLPIECGIALHRAKDALIDQDTIKAVMDDDSYRVEKSVVTQSSHIDLVHRLEKLVHGLPGSSILLTREIAQEVQEPDFNPVELGRVRVRGHEAAVELLMIPSDLLSPETIAVFRDKIRADLDDGLAPTGRAA